MAPSNTRHFSALKPSQKKKEKRMSSSAALVLFPLLALNKTNNNNNKKKTKRKKHAAHDDFEFSIVIYSFFFVVVLFPFPPFPVRWAGPLRWDGRSHGVHVRGPTRAPAASPGPPSEPRAAAARQPALRDARSSPERHAHEHGFGCQRRFKEG